MNQQSTPPQPVHQQPVNPAHVLLHTPVRPVSRVITLDQPDFDDACAELMRLVQIDFQPDILVGIRTGGLCVAEAMAKVAPAGCPVLPITCRRPSTRYKPFSVAARKLVAGLPRPLLDQLRIVEHRLLTRKPAAAPKAYHFDETELGALRAWFKAWTATGRQAPKVLIADDSVDTGTTMLHVSDVLHRHFGGTAVLRTAAVTVTTAQPAITPDYVLMRRQLCRFPWSLDAKVPRAC